MENHTQMANGASMATERVADGVRYEVRQTINGIERIIWSRFVAFGRNKANRVGGYAFRSASAEQERIAKNPPQFVP